MYVYTAHVDVVNYRTASFHSSFEDTMNTLPEQKRIQPHQIMNMPSMAFSGDGSGGLSLVRKALCRGFSITVATRPDTPPTKCTGPQPEMSNKEKMFMIDVAHL